MAADSAWVLVQRVNLKRGNMYQNVFAALYIPYCELTTPQIGVQPVLEICALLYD